MMKQNRISNDVRNTVQTQLRINIERLIDIIQKQKAYYNF